MRFTVVLTAAFPAVTRDLLAPHFDVVEHPTEHGRSEDDMISILAEADGAVTLLSDPMTRRVLQSNPNLRIVSNFAVGYNNIDIDAARELGVVVTNTPGVLTEATADLTLALMLAVTRRIVEGDAALRASGECLWDPLYLLGTSLQNRVLGIVGMGRIGRAVAKRAEAFGMRVIGIRSGEALEPLLQESDIVSIHAPLSSSTHHLFNRETFARMKQGAYLINTSRGALVHEEALCDALDSGHLRGAALDVYEHEPAVHPRLLANRKVVLAPHIGSATDEARSAMGQIAAENVLRFLGGLPPLHRVV
jgi:glyoxylate reductase